MTVTEQIDAKRTELILVANPMDVMAGSIDIDAELHKLSHNLKILVNLIYLSGSESTMLKQIYYRGRFDMMRSVTKEELKDLGVVPSQKDQFVKTALHQERADWENMEHQRKYFDNTYTTYVERINVYKKTRLKTNELQ
ncbi:hypothetical protein LCGC14_0831830 [marine sediment metagenome]|uniref:Uncharacterized protein n=1 Tax=marine sediment metagenome TaxID=412755 RepID=A0A0F9PKF3_9ZZZZ